MAETLASHRGGPTMRGTRFGRKNRPKTGPLKCSAGTNLLFSPRFIAMSVTATVNCAMGSGTHSSVQLDNRGRLWVCNRLPPVARCCCEMPRAIGMNLLTRFIIRSFQAANKPNRGAVGFPQLRLQPRQHQLLLHVLLQTYCLLYRLLYMSS